MNISAQMCQNTYHREQGMWNLLNEASRYYTAAIFHPCVMARQSRRSGVFCWKTSSGWEVYTTDKYVLIRLDGGAMSNLDSENSWLIKKPQSQLDPGTFLAENEHNSGVKSLKWVPLVWVNSGR